MMARRHALAIISLLLAAASSVPLHLNGHAAAARARAEAEARVAGHLDKRAASGLLTLEVHARGITLLKKKTIIDVYVSDAQPDVVRFEDMVYPSKASEGDVVKRQKLVREPYPGHWEDVRWGVKLKLDLNSGTPGAWKAAVKRFSAAMKALARVVEKEERGYGKAEITEATTKIKDLAWVRARSGPVLASNRRIYRCGVRWPRLTRPLSSALVRPRPDSTSRTRAVAGGQRARSIPPRASPE